MDERRTAIVTGASSGIGLATARALIAAGHNVFGVDVAAAPTSLDSGGSNPHFEFLRADLTADGVAMEVVATARSAFTGPVHALLNVAGVMDSCQGVDCYDDGQWERCMAINLTAPVRLMRAFVNALRAQGRGGVVVNVASKAAISGAAAGIAYTSSKAGLVGATKSVAFRFKDEGIRCNAICPGSVKTDIGKSMDMTKMDVAAATKLEAVRSAAHPESLMLMPEDVANLLVYLVSDASAGVTGSIIPIDNGWSTI